MSFADCMQDLEKTNEYSEAITKARKPSFFEKLAKQMSRIVSQPRPAVRQPLKH